MSEHEEAEREGDLRDALSQERTRPEQDWETTRISTWLNLRVPSYHKQMPKEGSAELRILPVSLLKFGLVNDIDRCGLQTSRIAFERAGTAAPLFNLLSQ